MDIGKIIKRIWNNPVWSNLIATILFSLLIYFKTSFKDSIKGESFNDRFIHTVNYPIKLYYVIIFFLLLIIFNAIKKAIKNSNKFYELRAPQGKYLEYIRDEFGIDKRKWTWNYDWDIIDKKYIIINLVPMCDICGSNLFYDGNSNANTGICPKCRLEGQNYIRHIQQHIADVRNEIVRRLLNGEWQKVLLKDSFGD